MSRKAYIKGYQFGIKAIGINEVIVDLTRNYKVLEKDMASIYKKLEKDPTYYKDSSYKKEILGLKKPLATIQNVLQNLHKENKRSLKWDTERFERALAEYDRVVSYSLYNLLHVEDVWGGKVEIDSREFLIGARGILVKDGHGGVPRLLYTLGTLIEAMIDYKSEIEKDAIQQMRR
jgi:hypothetical protein